MHIITMGGTAKIDVPIFDLYPLMHFFVGERFTRVFFRFLSSNIMDVVLNV